MKKLILLLLLAVPIALGAQTSTGFSKYRIPLPLRGEVQKNYRLPDTIHITVKGDSVMSLYGQAERVRIQFPIKLDTDGYLYHFQGYDSITGIYKVFHAVPAPEMKEGEECDQRWLYSLLLFYRPLTEEWYYEFESPCEGLRLAKGNKKLADFFAETLPGVIRNLGKAK